jgi:diguanylate cyclase (GGDEF)-like protein
MLIGTFLFATSMFVDFFALLRKRTAAEARSEVYNKMAHTDMMTGLSNRRRCEEELDSLAQAKAPYALISFDLNDLKKTNDNYGHAEGDRLLTDFSSLLLEVFPYDSIICRTGGDEFITIIKDLSTTSPDTILENLEAKKNQLNKERTPLPLSYACGYCISTEVSVKEGLTGRALVDEVLRISDARMYGNKAIIKGQM